ncbi:hypothetical protein V6N13_008049 [Hibiscus sabdariffa]
MASNMSLQHWCTRGQLKEKDKIAPIPAYTWTPKPAVSAQERTPMAPQVELKEMPTHLKYAFWGDNDTLPVIVSSKLSKREEDDLV